MNNQLPCTAKYLPCEEKDCTAYLVGTVYIKGSLASQAKFDKSNPVKMFAVTIDTKAREDKRKHLEKTVKDGRYEVGAGNMIAGTGKGGKINFEMALMDKVGYFEKVLGELPSWVTEGEIVIEITETNRVKKPVKKNGFVVVKCSQCHNFH